MRGPRVFNLLVCSALVGFSLTARGDTGSAAGTPPHPIHEYWKQTDPGPASALWSRADLAPDERAYVDHAANASDEAVNAAFASATAERAEQAAHDAAAEQLGLTNLGDEGVVP